MRPLLQTSAMEHCGTKTPGDPKAGFPHHLHRKSAAGMSLTHSGFWDTKIALAEIYLGRRLFFMGYSFLHCIER